MSLQPRIKHINNMVNSLNISQKCCGEQPLGLSLSLNKIHRPPKQHGKESLNENQHIEKQDKSGVKSQNPEIGPEASVNERVPMHTNCEFAIYATAYILTR